MGLFKVSTEKNIEVDPEKCRGCGACLEACPRGALEQGKEVNSGGFAPVKAVHPEKCVRCGLCAVLCPERAIRLRK